jgi:hypothetical protein
MKKYLAVLALLVSGSVFAETTGSVSYQVQQNDSGTQGHVMNYKLSNEFYKHLEGDLTVNNFVADGSNATYIRTEVGVTPKYDVTNFLTVASRFSVGNVQSSNHGKWQTYTIEPKIVAKLPYDFDATVGFRFRSGFGDNDLDTSRTYGAALGYNITKHDKVSLGVSKLSGDNGGVANNGNHTYAVTYARGF